MYIQSLLIMLVASGLHAVVQANINS